MDQLQVAIEQSLETLTQYQITAFLFAEFFICPCFKTCYKKRMRFRVESEILG